MIVVIPYIVVTSLFCAIFSILSPPIVGVGARLFRPAQEDPLIYSPHVRPAAHNLSIKSRVHPKYKTKYHVRNWASYEDALVRRGDLTVWLSADAIAAWTPAMQAGLATRRLTLRDIFVSVRRVVWWLSDVLAFADLRRTAAAAVMYMPVAA